MKADVIPKQEHWEEVLFDFLVTQILFYILN